MDLGKELLGMEGNSQEWEEKKVSWEKEFLIYYKHV